MSLISENGRPSGRQLSLKDPNLTFWSPSEARLRAPVLVVRRECLFLNTNKHFGQNGRATLKGTRVHSGCVTEITGLASILKQSIFGHLRQLDVGALLVPCYPNTFGPSGKSSGQKCWVTLVSASS